MKKDPNKVTKLIDSYSLQKVNNRFLVKMSQLDTGNDTPSILMVVIDLRESGFKMKFFSTLETADNFVRQLYMSD